MEWLLSVGVPWNGLDKEGLTAGDHALQQGHDTVATALIAAGCRAELILAAADRHVHDNASEKAFLQQELHFHEDCVVDANGEAVMMRWEAALMEAHAEALCVQGGDVLNVGFGMGLVDSAIQKRNPKSHTIIEAHPQVYEQMLAEGWDRRPGVKIIHGRWQDVVQDLSGFDSVFFDTYGEHYSDLREFHAHLPRLLKADGVYSFFNGLAPDNAFFHLVYCEIVKAELSVLGLTTQFVPLPIDVTDGEIWKKVRSRYWHRDVYYLPVAQLIDEET